MKIRMRIYRQTPVTRETSHLSSATFVLPVETAIPPLAEEVGHAFPEERGSALQGAADSSQYVAPHLSLLPDL